MVVGFCVLAVLILEHFFFGNAGEDFWGYEK